MENTCHLHICKQQFCTSENDNLEFHKNGGRSAMLLYTMYMYIWMPPGTSKLSLIRTILVRT